MTKKRRTLTIVGTLLITSMLISANTAVFAEEITEASAVTDEIETELQQDSDDAVSEDSLESEAEEEGTDQEMKSDTDQKAEENIESDTETEVETETEEAAETEETEKQTESTEKSEESETAETITDEEEVTEEELEDTCKHQEVIDEAVEATLFETGLTEGSHCSVCGEVIKAQEVVSMKTLTRTLKVGCYGSDVLQVQQKLYELGYLTVNPDGSYGSKTEAAVRSFQLNNGLESPDGKFGQWSLSVMRNNPNAYSADPITSTEIYRVQEVLDKLGFLTVEYDGYFGSYTVQAIKELQLYNGLDITGELDTATMKVINSSSACGYRMLSKGCSGTDVYNIQVVLKNLGYLTVTPDGIYGNKTKTAVSNMQQKNGLSSPDGIFGRWSVTLITSGNVLIYEENSGVYNELKPGMNNEYVLKLQKRLKELGYLTATPDGYYGNKTEAAVSAFQLYNYITVTGRADQTTLKKIYSDVCTPFRSLKVGSVGHDVYMIQKYLYALGYLTAAPDGTFGSKTKAAVMDFQSKNGCSNPDGVFGNWSLTILFIDPVAYTPEIDSNVALGEQIVNYAMSWVGVTPYVNAEDRWTENGYWNSLIEGTDCSGFTHLIYEQFGIYVPTGSDAYQDWVGEEITYDQLLPGDIVVYRFGGHVAIYAGNDTIIHCSNPDDGTKISNMWYSTPTKYVRVVF